MNTKSGKKYLAIPFDEKDEAKSIAGKLITGEWALGFDSNFKSWFAKEGTDLSKLEKWFPENRVDTSDRINPVEEFGGVLEAHGFVLNGLPIMDGKSHRCMTVDDKRGQRSGSYRGFAGIQYGGWYIDYRNDSEGHKWQAKGVSQSDEVRRANAAQNAVRYEKLKEETEKRYTHHALRVRKLLSLLPDASSHPYLSKKCVSSFPGLKIDKKNRLVIPLYDENGDVWSIQRISTNGFKRIKKGARKSGLFFALKQQRLRNGSPILIGEGYSTCASIAMASSITTIMGVDAGNLPKVAETMKKLFPDSLIIIMGDDDRGSKSNKGRDKAEEAAKGVGGIAVFPEFNDKDEGLSDWNDIHCRYGIQAVMGQISDLI